MKKKNLNSKLKLNKQTITNLNMSKVKGGIYHLTDNPTDNPTDTFPHWPSVPCSPNTAGCNTHIECSAPCAIEEM